MKKYLLLFVFLFFCSHFFSESVKATWDKSSYKLGDEAILTILLPKLPENFFIEGISSSKNDLNDYRILSLDKVRFEDGSVLLKIKVIVFSTGKVAFPVNQIKILTEKNESVYSLEIPSMVVEDRISSSDSPPVIAAPVEIPKSSSLTQIIIIIVTILMVIFLLIYKYLKIKSSQLTEVKRTAKKTIEEYLIEKIETKFRNNVLSLQDYSELTEDLRKFLAEKYQIDALYMTTSELFEILKTNFPFKLISFSETVNIFTLADFVKFAKHFPDQSEENKFRAIFLLLLKELKEIFLRKERLE